MTCFVKVVVVEATLSRTTILRSPALAGVAVAEALAETAGFDVAAGVADPTVVLTPPEVVMMGTWLARLLHQVSG